MSRAEAPREAGSVAAEAEENGKGGEFHREGGHEKPGGRGGEGKQNGPAFQVSRGRGSPGEGEAERKGSGSPEGENPRRAVEVPGGRLRSPEGENPRRVESSEGSPPTLVCEWGLFLS